MKIAFFNALSSDFIHNKKTTKLVETCNFSFLKAHTFAPK